MPKKLKKIYSFLLISLNLLTFSNSQNLDKSVLKAAGCLTLVKKLKNKPDDQRVMTGLLLSCFINVDEETADILLKNQFYEKMGIEDSEVMKLIDFNTIQKKYSQEQIEEYSKALNKALEPLRDNGDGKRKSSQPIDPENPNYEDDDYGNTGSLINSIINLLTSSDSLLLLFVLFVVFYFCLQKVRKWFGGSDKSSSNNTISNKKNNKNSKNNKRKKK